MSENNKNRNENNPEDDPNINWPTFDSNEEKSSANRLYVSELQEDANPGVQRIDPNKVRILKFDWYFSTCKEELSSREFSVPNSGKVFILKAQSSPWMEFGKQVQVFLLNIDDSPQNVSIEYNVILRKPNWEKVEELRGCQEFNYAFKCLDLFCIKGKPVDILPVDQTATLMDGVELIPRVYGVKGTLKVIKDRVQNWKLLSSPSKEVECFQLKLDEEDN